MSYQLDAVDPMVVTLRQEAAKKLADGTRFRFELCITEALTNLVTHAKGDAMDNSIEIKMYLKDGYVKAELFDPLGAAPFNPCSVAQDLSEIDYMAEGGRGIGLIMECADSVDYGPSGTRNSLRIEFWDADQTADPHPDNGEQR